MVRTYGGALCRCERDPGGLCRLSVAGSRDVSGQRRCRTSGLRSHLCKVTQSTCGLMQAHVHTYVVTLRSRRSWYTGKEALSICS